MRLTSILRTLSLPLFTLMAFQSIPHAQAGFQWVPSEDNPPATIQNAPAYIPPVTNEPIPAPSDVLVPLAVNPQGDHLPLVANPFPDTLSNNSYVQDLQNLTPAAPAPLEPLSPVPLQPAPLAVQPDLPIFAPEPFATDVLTPPAPILNTKKIGTRKSEDIQIQSDQFVRPVQDIQAPSADRSYADARREARTIQNVSPAPVESLQQVRENAWESRRVVPDTPPPAAILNPVPAPFEPVDSSPTPRITKTDVQHNQYSVVDGFGSDLPLALALSQVVPPEYSYSFGPGVNAGARVSWNGGKPWSQVLDSMVSGAQLKATISGQTVFLQQNNIFDRSSLVRETATEAVKTDISDAPAPFTKRNKIMDPGEHPVAKKTVKVEHTIEPVSRFPQPNRSAVAPLTPLPNASLQPPQAIAAPEPFSSTTPYPERAASREKLSQRIQRDIEAENIELRLRAQDVVPTPPVPADNFAAPNVVYQQAPIEPLRPLDRGRYVDPPLPPFVSAQELEYHSLGLAKPPTPTLSTQSVSQKDATFSQGRVTARKVSAAERQIWEARKGDSLKQTLVQWSRDANINLVWNAPQDYRMSSNVLVNGTFKNAIKAVFTEGLVNQDTPTLRFVDDPSTNQPTTFIVGERG